MNRNLHIERHKELHACLDELAADYLVHNKGKLLSGTSILDLMQWSNDQTTNPTNNEGNHAEGG
jgi:hypothetical protein